MDLVFSKLFETQKLPQALALLHRDPGFAQDILIDHFSKIFPKVATTKSLYEVPEIFMMRSQENPSETVKLERAREVIQWLSLNLDRNRYIICTDVHLVSPLVLNALLKTVEEPPPRCHFIFTSVSRDMILPTLASRLLFFSLETQVVAPVFPQDSILSGWTDSIARKIAEHESYPQFLEALQNLNLNDEKKFQAASQELKTLTQDQSFRLALQYACLKRIKRCFKNPSLDEDQRLGLTEKSGEWMQLLSRLYTNDDRSLIIERFVMESEVYVD